MIRYMSMWKLNTEENNYMCEREDVIAGVVELNIYEKIQLKFPPSTVTKEYSQTCNSEFIDVRQGRNSNEKHLGTRALGSIKDTK